MKVFALVTAVLFASSTWQGAGVTPLVFGGKVGDMPAGWKSGVTGKADGSVWKLVEDKTAPGGSLALAQTSKSATAIFNLCTYQDGKYKDVDISIAFKAIAGETDQGGGIFWRMKDNDNYYV